MKIKKIKYTFGGLENLMQLVKEHVRKSKSIRDHLQLLTFNSIIEASKLGTKAMAILAIVRSIKGVSSDWSQITDQSEQAMQQVMTLAKETNQLMGAFSVTGDNQLREAQEETKTGLDSLRAAAGFAAGQAQGMESATQSMQAGKDL